MHLAVRSIVLEIFPFHFTRLVVFRQREVQLLLILTHLAQLSRLLLPTRTAQLFQPAQPLPLIYLYWPATLHYPGLLLQPIWL